jgi:Amt family ammonium transporter
MIKWFQNLKVAQKLAIISLVFVLPDSIMLYLFITSINEYIQFARLEQVGNQYQRPLERLLDLVPQQRLEARRQLAGPAADSDLGRLMAARMRVREHDIDAAFDVVESVDARIGKTLGFTPEGLAKRQRQGCDVNSVRAEWEQVKAETDSEVATDARDQKYLQLIDHIRSMIAHAGDMSNLILDPELDSYYLVDATLMGLPQTQDRISHTMGDGEDLFKAKGDDVGRDRVTLAVDLAFLKVDDLERINTSVQTALTSGNPLYGLHPSFQERVPGALKAYYEAGGRFNDLVDRLQNGDTRSVTLEQYLAAGDAARDASFNLWSVADEELNKILQGRIDYYVFRRTRSLGVAGGALVAAFSLVTFITKSISGPLKKQALQLRATNEELSKARKQLEVRVVQSRDALERTEQKYRKIFENAVMGIFQVSPQGVFRSANPALAKIFGYDSPEQLVANDGPTNLALYVDPDTRALFSQLMQERGYVVDFQSEIHCKEGTRWVSENARRVRDSRGQIYYEGTLEDITQRKRAEAEERRAHENAEEARVAAEAARVAAEAASTAKSDFLATMSHEIRTPLNGVIGIADLLTQTSLTAQQTRYVKIIQSSSDSLLSIINQILDFSKIEAGKLDLAERTFDLPLAVEEVVVLLAQKAASKGLELACQIDPLVPSRVRGDDDRLRQVLMNIVNNAIKFTSRGEVVVRVSEDGRQNGQPGVMPETAVKLRFTVTDTGPGIPADRLDRLFKSFSQVDTSVTRQYGGTGLGLAICKQLAELMGGEIGVDSSPGKGSTFWFTVKMGLEQGATCDVAPLSLSGRRVLIVDDSLTQCQFLQEQLAAWGVRATYATSAEVALQELSTGVNKGQAFEVAIVDLNMPGMGGLELARIVQGSPALGAMPLILMSGVEVIGAAEEGRFGQFLTKPIRQSNLHDAIMKALVRTNGATAVPEATVAAASSTMAPKQTRILLAEDMDVNQFVVTETLSRDGYGCDIVNNGREAVAAVAGKTYDIILMDCQMPEMSGFEATAAIREMERAKGAGAHRVRIIALTANAVKGDRDRCLAAGMDDYLTKPIKPSKLIACIESHAPAGSTARVAPSAPAAVASAGPLASPIAPAPAAMVRPDLVNPAADQLTPGRPEAATVAPVRPTEPAPQATPVIAPQPGESAIDFDDLLARCDGDKVMMARLIEKFQVKSTRSWAELLASYKTGDAAATTRLAHALKGTASNLSAHKVASLAARLEDLGHAADLGAAETLVRDLGVELERCQLAFAGLTRGDGAGPRPATANLQGQKVI